ncbi:MAG: DNA polymerase Y family protein [Acidimicrobiia bacterium]
MPERTLALWCPAWSVTTARREDPALVGAPVAVVERGARGQLVRAVSAEARDESVTVGLRRREAEARCAGLVVVDRDPAAEARAFEVVARATEPITPAVVLERPGVLTFPTRGPSRYFGGDDALATRVLAIVTEAGVDDARVGIADGGFASRLATRRAARDQSAGTLVVPAGGSAEFLAPWPVAVLRGVLGTETEGDAFVSLLVRLGLRTLGDFAALPAPSVLARFGAGGARAHRLACGLEEHAAPPMPPPPELAETCELDPPATRVDEVAFAAKGLADRLFDRLELLGLSCSQVVVEAETEHGERHARCWRHEGGLTAASLVTRVRWQLDAWLTGRSPEGPQGEAEVEEATAGLTFLRIAPDRVVPATGRQLGLWGGDAASADRAERVLARIQGMLGHEAVATAVVVGGRAPVERIRWVPWGEPRDAPGASGADAAPWPGAVPGPPPARVHPEPVPAELLDADGADVRVSGRGEATAEPAWLRCALLPGGGGRVLMSTGPWAHDLRWWDRLTCRRRVLWHVVVATPDESGPVACLASLEGGRAAVEAVYD